MENPPVGLRFRPTDEEIIDVYLRPKNLDGDTSHVDRVISTVTICSFDPWELPSESRMKLKDEAWCFFSRKENKYGRGERQIRKTKSGYWKITGKPKAVMRNREKIGEKKVLMFYYSKQLGGSKSDWVIHEYHLFSPNQMMMTYTICKVMSKGEDREISSSSTASEVENNHALIPHMNNSGGFSPRSEGSYCQELQNPSQFDGFLDVQQETQLQDAVRRAINNISSDDWNYLLNADEQTKIVSMQEDCSDYRPQKPLTGVFTDDSSDDNDSDLISATTSSIETSSTCGSIGSSNHRIDQIKTQLSLDSTIKLVASTQEVSQNLGQGTEIREHKLGQETIKKKSACFCNRMIQRFVKKIQLCSPISRT